MYHPLLTKTGVVWLFLSLLTLSLGTPPAAMAGSTPAGGGSGSTTSGSVPLPIGGSPITAETTSSKSANVSLDPQTDSLQPPLEAPASLNQTAFVTMATAGGAYEQVLALMVAVGDAVADGATGKDIDPNQLNQAMLAYRALVSLVDTATFDNFRDNSGFIGLNHDLQSLRDAIET